MVKLLLSYGASADVVDDEGISPKRAALKAARSVQVRAPLGSTSWRSVCGSFCVHGQHGEASLGFNT